METVKINNRLVSFNCDENNLQIMDSYKITSPGEMASILNTLRKYIETNYNITYKRKVSSWLVEWQAHNLYYDFNINVSRAKDVDLNENESTFKIIIYHISSLIYEFIKKQQ